MEYLTELKDTEVTNLVSKVEYEGRFMQYQFCLGSAQSIYNYLNFTDEDLETGNIYELFLEL